MSTEKNWISYRAVVSYQGTYFDGWQSQPHKKTIQDTIESALYKLFSCKQKIIGASRTDAGVHAFGQVFTFLAPIQISEEKLINLLNNNLIDTIYIRKIEKTSENFHPRFQAKKKIYQYCISEKKMSPEKSFFIYCSGCELDINSFQQLSNLFIGTYNFKFFSKIEKKSTIINTFRTIYAIDISLLNNVYIITIVGNGFLRYMIRKVLGFILHESKKKQLTENDIKKMLQGEINLPQSPLLPAKGLLLKDILYSDQEIISFDYPYLFNN